MIFTLQTPSWADDIRDFQIEGMSIGDSLLDYFSKEEIKEGMRLDYYISKKFIRVEFWEAKTNVYDVLSVHIKNKDNKYIIYEIAGAILFDGNVNECYSEQKKIIRDLSSLFKNAEGVDSGRQIHKAVDNESTYDRYDFNFQSGASIDVICYDWSETSGNTDHLAVGVNTREFDVWLSTEAYQ